MGREGQSGISWGRITVWSNTGSLEDMQLVIINLVKELGTPEAQKDIDDDKPGQEGAVHEDPAIELQLDGKEMADAKNAVVESERKEPVLSAESAHPGPISEEDMRRLVAQRFAEAQKEEEINRAKEKLLAQANQQQAPENGGVKALRPWLVRRQEGAPRPTAPGSPVKWQKAVR